MPFPSVTFSDVVVGDEAQPSMTISRFSMDAELAPFLSGEVLIFDMRVEAPKAVVRVLEDGRLDWALKRKPTPPGDLVVLERVSISDADITIVDDQNGRTHKVSNVDALVSAKSLSGPWLVEAEGEIAGLRGGLSLSTGIAQADGSIRMRVRVVPDAWPVLLETEGEARIEGDKPLYDGLFTFTALSDNGPGGVVSEKPLVVAKGDFAATNERLTIEQWRAEIGFSTDPYIVTGQATIDTGPNPEFLLLADGQQIDMNRLAGEETAPDGAETAAVPLGERLAIINAMIDRLPPPPLPGRISLNLPAIVAGDTTLREISLEARPDGNAWLVDSFSANLPGRTTVEANGRLMSGSDASFEGQLTVASTQPSGLANWLVGEVDPVIRRLGAAGFSANVSLSSALQRFEALEVAVGPAILKGRLERQTPQSGTPTLSVELSGDTFDVDAVQALVLLGQGEGNAVRPLEEYNLAARITADTFTAGHYSLKGLDTSMFWRDRQLTIERLKFADFGGASGEFTGSLAGSFAAPRGEIGGGFTATSASGLFALAEQVSGGHQIIRRLGANSAAFDDLTAELKLTLDPDVGPSLTVTGVTGGSAYKVTAVGTGLTPGGDGPRTITVNADNPESYPLLEQLGFRILPLEGEGPASLSLAASGGASNGDLAIELELNAAGSQILLNGNGRIPASDPATGLFSLAVDSADIEPLIIMSGHSIPQGGAGLPLSMTASLAFNDQTALLSDITGQAEDNTFSGRLEFDRSASVLSARGAVRVDYANLEWLGELALGPQLSSLDGAAWSDQPFLPPASGQPEMQLGLEAARIDLGRGGVAQNFKAGLSTATGLMSLDNAEMDWFGGRLGGRVSVSNVDGSVFLSGKIEAASAGLAALDRAVRGTASLSGAAGASASIEGTGKSMRELVASLAGGGQLTADNLAISGIDPGGFVRILGAADREGFEIEANAVAGMVDALMAGGEMKTDSLQLPFTLTGGVMRFTSTGFTYQDAELSGDARLDLVGLRLEADWRLAFEPGVEAVAGGDPSVVFSLNGLLADPGVSIDASQMTNFLSMRAFERERRKVELLQAGVVEKQRLRRVIALLNERAAQREAAEAARLEAEEAARVAEEEAARLAAEEQKRPAEEQAQRKREKEAAAQRAAEEAARLAAEAQAQREREQKAAAQRAAEEAARQRSLNAPDAIERRPLPDPLADPPSAIADDPPALDMRDFQFEDLPGVDDPIRRLIMPDG